MNRYFQAEKMKYCHTFLPFLIILMPAVCVLLSAMMSYNYFVIDSYNWWYGTMFPGFTAILCGMISSKDRKKQNRTVWALPVDTGKIWDAKLLLAAVAAAAAMVTATVLTVVGTELLRNGLHMTVLYVPTLPRQFLVAGIIWATSLWQIPVCLFFSQKLGTPLTFLIHVPAIVLGGVMLSLTKWFFVLPHGITNRAMCAVLGVLPNGLPAEPGSATYSPELVKMSGVWLGLASAILWFFLLWLLGRTWYKKQPERQ